MVALKNVLLLLVETISQAKKGCAQDLGKMWVGVVSCSLVGVRSKGPLLQATASPQPFICSIHAVMAMVHAPQHIFTTVPCSHMCVVFPYVCRFLTLFLVIEPWFFKPSLKSERRLKPRSVSSNAAQYLTHISVTGLSADAMPSFLIRSQCQGASNALVRMSATLSPVST